MFDLFDFWDGRDGLVDGTKVADVLRCIGMNPTNGCVNKNGGAKKIGGSEGNESYLVPTTSLVHYERAPDGEGPLSVSKTLEKSTSVFCDLLSNRVELKYKKNT